MRYQHSHLVKLVLAGTWGEGCLSSSWNTIPAIDRCLCLCRAQLETSYQQNIPAAVGPVPPRGPAANGPLAPMFGGLGGPPGPMGPMGFYPAAMGPQPPRGPGGESALHHLEKGSWFVA